jgi:A/G-specific adenine glycosylase
MQQIYRLSGGDKLISQSCDKPFLIEIGCCLVSWFQEHKRDLLWRKDYSPYKIWIAEIMLQQTRVKTVLPYYERWMERFDSIESVAGAKEEELLKCWEGLGYYSRAKNIHRTAQILMDRYAGKFPRDRASILSLPGIGAYTAGAIMSIAFNAHQPLLDGNVKRVFARLFNISGATEKAATEKFMLERAKELIPKGKARELNQALMELGALICLPRKF